MRRTQRLSLITVWTLMVWTVLFCGPVFAEINQGVDALIRQADKAMELKEPAKAEKLYLQVLTLDPKNWRVMFSLAQIKYDSKKFQEAKELLDRILAIPMANGRDVLVYYPGVSQPEAAELVDEIVLPPQRTKNNMRNYLDIKGNEPLPHYRLFFKKRGVMQLVPQSVVRVEYQGVLRTVYEKVRELDVKTEKALIAAGGSLGNAEMVTIKGGCFQMGSQVGTPAEQPVHEVCVNGFKMNKNEVTQAAFQAVMKTNPSQIIGPNRPVDSVTWFEAEQFCKKQGQRLPTEAEWEFAARGGTTSHFYWGNTVKGQEGNFCDKNCRLNIRVRVADDKYALTAPVGQYPPNPTGLFDMAGNVSEWVEDWMDPNYYRQSPKDNPHGPRPLSNKVARGGGWNTTAGYLRSSNRASYLPDFRNEGVGFRCVAGL